MKILIAVPCMDQVAAGFAQSLATLNKVGECAVVFIVGSLIYDSRNKIATQAVEVGADYVMWFDSDMIFSPDTLQKLIADDKDIVSGLYHRRTAPYTPVLFSEIGVNDDGTAKWSNYDDHPDSLFRCEGIGFGCVLVKAEVLFDMAAKYHDWFGPTNGFGEDLSFCLRAKELGFEIWCDPTVNCGHVGHMVIDDKLYKAMRGAKK